MNRSNSTGLLSQALGLHQQGQLEQAAVIYLQLLHQEPENFGALQLLGVLRSQQGRHVEAKKLLEAALQRQPQDFGALLNYGQVLMGSGAFQEALNSFDKVLSAKPDLFEALYNRGVALAQLRRHTEAVASFEDALLLNAGGNVACHYNRALSLSALKRHAEALAGFDHALAINPNFAPALGNRGNSLRELGRPSEALDSYDRALILTPRDIRVIYNRGNALSDLHRLEDAISSYDRALAITPHFAEALFSRGLALLGLQRFSEALDSLNRALELRPGDTEILNNCGVAMWHLHRFQDAKAFYDKALARDPNHAATLLNRAFVYREAGQLQAALADYEQAMISDPGNARAWNGRGSVLHVLKRGSEALAHFDKAIALDPGFADALVNRASLRWAERGDYAGAVSDLQAALTANPAQPFARGELLHLRMYGADWDNFDEQASAIDQAVRQGQRVVRPFVYQALSHSPADLQSCSRIFAASLFDPRVPQPDNFTHHHQKIRIGYVSAEFREQATAYLMAGLYEMHDRAKFEVFAIDNGGGDASAMRQRLERAFDRFIYISHMSDEEAADSIRRQEIDILVNLNGYFGAPRMGVFARRAAPIQVNYLGFPATLGSPCMDYIIADRIVIPDEERRYYDEQVIYLPHSYQANDSKRSIAQEIPSRAALGLPEDGFVFCNFNQSYKITPSVFASWMRILREVEGSVLWLLGSKPPFEANLSKAARRHGVAPHRLVFAPSLPQDRHLARLKQADLFLDTLPYNAHTTASDALWSGLPLLTCRGSTFPGRVAASLLTAVGMPELITESLAEYESRAIALAHSTGTISALKKTLNSNRLSHPLFNTDLFRKNIEEAYIAMWEAWRNREISR